MREGTSEGKGEQNSQRARASEGSSKLHLQEDTMEISRTMALLFVWESGSEK